MGCSVRLRAAEANTSASTQITCGPPSELLRVSSTEENIYVGQMLGLLQSTIHPAWGAHSGLVNHRQRHNSACMSHIQPGFFLFCFLSFFFSDHDHAVCNRSHWELNLNWSENFQTACVRFGRSWLTQTRFARARDTKRNQKFREHFQNKMSYCEAKRNGFLPERNQIVFFKGGGGVSLMIMLFWC